MEDINLHFTGDLHAITSANNLLSAIIDNHIYHGNKLHIKNVVWKRCADVNDRALRNVRVAISKDSDGREEKFDITAASEMMAILCLAENVEDLKRRIGNIIIGFDENDRAILCKELKAEGALTALLKDAIKPNLVQTLENNPCFVHGGPFANIAHGCNSIIATRMALKLGDYVVTEAGFGADLGAEKFMNIKERMLNVKPSCVVIVVTLKAIKYHGGSSIDDCELTDIEKLDNGIANLRKHIANIKSFGVNVIVGINVFEKDSEEELEELREKISDECECSFMRNWEKGSDGTIDIAKKLINICEKTNPNEQNDINFTYDLNDSIEDKINKIAKNIYGAGNVEFSDEAKKQISEIKSQNLNLNVPVCIAKTQYSLSDDPKNLLCDKPFTLHITDIEYKGGAEFIVAKSGNIMTMPGLPEKPAYENIDVDEEGNIIGIF